MGIPAVFPNILRLVVRRPQVAQPEQDLVSDNQRRTHSTSARNPKSRGTHDQIAGTLHRIAESYALFPETEDLPLRIPGCEGKTYGACFERLVNTSRLRIRPAKIYSGEMSFRKIVIQDEIAQVVLSPVWWAPGEGGKFKGMPYRVAFDMTAWGERRKEGFLGELQRRRMQQAQLHDENNSVCVNLFFLGSQDREDLTLFHVNDPRLVYFREMPKVKPKDR